METTRDDVTSRSGGSSASEFNLGMATAAGILNEIVSGLNRDAPEPDGRTHSEECYRWHSDCMGRRVLRLFATEASARL